MVNSEMGYKCILLNTSIPAYSFHSEHTFNFFPRNNNFVTTKEQRRT